MLGVQPKESPLIYNSGCWATLPLAKLRSVSSVRRRRRGSLSHRDTGTAWPLGPETVSWPASMIRACRCPPRLAGPMRATGKPPAACATRMKAAALERKVVALLHGVVHARPCNGQSSKCPSGRGSDFTLLASEWLAREFRKVFFPKYPQLPAITRRCPSHRVTH